MGVEVQRIVGSGKRWPPDSMSDPAYAVMVDGRQSFTLTMADVEETIKSSLLGQGAVIISSAKLPDGMCSYRGCPSIAREGMLFCAAHNFVSPNSLVGWDEGKKIYDRGWNDGIDAFKRNYDGMVEVIRRLRS